MRETTQRKNKLIAICDELFPEFTHILHDPNLPTALAFRETFPTPQSLAIASFSSLQAVRGTTRSLSDAKLLELQRLAAQSIGTRELIRQRSLVLEQEQLITELRLQNAHIQQLDQAIVAIVDQAREGQILCSMGLGPIQAASIIAAIGSILNFPNAGTLKSYSSVAWSNPTRPHPLRSRGPSLPSSRPLSTTEVVSSSQPNHPSAEDTLKIPYV